MMFCNKRISMDLIFSNSEYNVDFLKFIKGLRSNLVQKRYAKALKYYVQATEYIINNNLDLEIQELTKMLLAFNGILQGIYKDLKRKNLQNISSISTSLQQSAQHLQNSYSTKQKVCLSGYILCEIAKNRLAFLLDQKIKLDLNYLKNVLSKLFDKNLFLEFYDLELGSRDDYYLNYWDPLVQVVKDIFIASKGIQNYLNGFERLILR